MIFFDINILVLASHQKLVTNEISQYHHATTMNCISGRNNGQKLVGHFLKIGHFVGY